MPPVKAKALDNTEVALPKDGSQQPVILVLGFSRKSGEMCAPWGKRLASDFRFDSRISYYQLPVLEDAPSFVRPMIARGIRKDTAPADLPHMLPIFDHEADWKKLVGFSNADDAYIVLSDPHGLVLWKTHGAVNDSSYRELKSAVSKLLANAPSASPAATKP
jgi:hypothetical protein